LCESVVVDKINAVTLLSLLIAAYTFIHFSFNSSDNSTVSSIFYNNSITALERRQNQNALESFN